MILNGIISQGWNNFQLFSPGTVFPLISAGPKISSFGYPHWNKCLSLISTSPPISTALLNMALIRIVTIFYQKLNKNAYRSTISHINYWDKLNLGKTYGSSGMLQHIGRVATPKLAPRNCLKYSQEIIDNRGRGIGLKIYVRYCLKW